MGDEPHGSFLIFYQEHAKHMNQKKNINVIFIIQREEKLGYKDIAHCLPFLYFLSKNKDYEYIVKILIFDTNDNYLQNIDQRVKQLSNLKNVELVFLYKENFSDKVKQFLVTESNSKITKIFNRILNKFYIKFKKIKKRSIDWRSNLGQEFIKSNTPLIFTLHNSGPIVEIVSQLKKQNTAAKWVVLPHGTILCDNQMLLESDLDKQEVVKNDNAFDKIDYFVRTSERDLENAILSGLNKDKGIVIGSPRYCEEWLKIKSNLELDGKEVIKNSKYKISILFLIPKKDINIFHEELIRTIDFISSYQEFELILLNYNSHYPKIPRRIFNRYNVRHYLISKEYSTSKLIDWADIVFHAGTGVIFESFIKEKITVLPRYLSCNTFISDKYDAGFNLSNRDELRTFCNAAVVSLINLKNTYKKKYSHTNKKFVDDFVYANTASVPENIIKTISFINKSFKS